MKSQEIQEVLQQFIMAYGPCGFEDNIREVLDYHLRDFCDEVFTDAAGNLIAKISGQDPALSPIKVVGHMDELSMIVKRIHPDGSLHLRALGCLYPAQIGQGPVDILANETLPGVLSFGCTHVSSESTSQYETIPEAHHPARALTWNDVNVFTGLSLDAIRQKGVKPGTRVVIAKDRRKIFPLGDYLASHFMDDRAPLTAMWATIRALHAQSQKPKQDTYFIFTVNEEITADGAIYSLARIPGDISISMEIGPVQPEFDVWLTADPIIAYQDGRALYDFKESEKLANIAKEHDIAIQEAVFENLGSDASIAKSHGQVAKALMIGIPTANSHGFEIIHQDSIQQASKLLLKYLMQ